jgi:zinc finger CCHC domain-containing protein 8
MGLPFTEDHASLKIRKPRQECFNCLSINHRVQECPVKIDEERISIHRNLFTTQSFHAQEQAQLLSNRYTSDLESKANRGFMPGKISNELREALGLKSNQLPPYIYIMRQYGYPIGWFLEARVKEAKLAVHDGKDNNNEIDEKKEKEEGMIHSDEGNLIYL